MTKKVTATFFTNDDFAEIKVNLIEMFNYGSNVMGSVLRYEVQHAREPLDAAQISELKNAKKYSDAFFRAVKHEKQLGKKAEAYVLLSEISQENIEFEKGKAYTEASKEAVKLSKQVAKKASKHARQYSRSIYNIFS